MNKALLILKDGILIKKLNTHNTKYRSKAFLYKYNKKFYVIREIGHQYNLSEKNVILLEKNINIYHKLLNNFSLLDLPSIFVTYTDVNKKIFLLTEYFSNGTILNLNINFKIKSFKKVAKIIIYLFLKNNNYKRSNLIYSIDPNPSNFYINSNREIVYNDFTPPLFLVDNKWKEFRRIDELKENKNLKQKRYFSGLNLLLVFVNKTRLYLSYNNYLRFIKWLILEIKDDNRLITSDFYILTDLIKEVENKKFSVAKYTNKIVLRDLVRFYISFNKNLKKQELNIIYKRYKIVNSNKVLMKVLKKYS